MVRVHRLHLNLRPRGYEPRGDSRLAYPAMNWSRTDAERMLYKHLASATEPVPPWHNLVLRGLVQDNPAPGVRLLPVVMAEIPFRFGDFPVQIRAAA